MTMLSKEDLNNLKYGRTAVGSAMNLFSTLSGSAQQRANDFAALKNMKPVKNIKNEEENKTDK